jgi:threonine dehydratase
VIAVEPERIPTLHTALAAGRPVDVDVGGITADSLGARRIGRHGFDAAVARRVESVLVPDEAIVDARRRLWDEARVAAEPGGATALAALVTGAHRPRPGERVAVVVCGGNADPCGL